METQFCTESHYFYIVSQFCRRWTLYYFPPNRFLWVIWSIWNFHSKLKFPFIEFRSLLLLPNTVKYLQFIEVDKTIDEWKWIVQEQLTLATQNWEVQLKNISIIQIHLWHFSQIFNSNFLKYIDYLNLLAFILYKIWNSELCYAAFSSVVSGVYHNNG